MKTISFFIALLTSSLFMFGSCGRSSVEDSTTAASTNIKDVQSTVAFTKIGNNSEHTADTEINFEVERGPISTGIILLQTIFYLQISEGAADKFIWQQGNPNIVSMNETWSQTFKYTPPKV